MTLIRTSPLVLVAAVALLALCGMARGADVSLEIKIEGLPGELTKNVEAVLSVVKLKAQATFTVDQLRRAHRRAEKEIRSALEPFGYYSPKIETSLKQENGKWLALYTIDAGSPVVVETVAIEIEGEGKNDANFEKLRRDFPLRAGSTLVHSQYDAGKRALMRYALDNGYLDAKFLKHEIAVNRGAARATVSLQIDSGPRYRFGAIEFKQDVIDEEYLRRYVPFKAGDLYSSEKLLDFHNALYDTEYFGSVDIRADRERAEDLTIPVLATLDAQPRHRYTAGLGYGTDTGPRGSLGWTNRRFNRRGDRMKAMLKVSDVIDSLGTAYVVPIGNPRTDQLEYSVNWEDDTSGDQEDESWVYGVSRSVSRREGRLETIYLNFRTDSYAVGNDIGNTDFLIPGITWSWLRATKSPFPLSGYRFSIDLRGANEEVFSDGTFVQTILNGKVIVGLGENNRALLRGEVGSTTYGDVRGLPPALRFFAGGDLSVRGYAYESLSPDDEGGEQLLVGSVELEHRFAPDWSVATFVDAGNAMDDWSATLMKGAGVGIRWHSPVGPLRVDVAQALSLDDRPWRLHIVLGPTL